MSYLTITRISGDPDVLAAGYVDAAHTMAAVGRDHGLHAHIAARADDGLVIVNLWPSQDGSEAASRDPRRLSVIAEGPISATDIHPQHFDVIDHSLE